MRPYEHKKLTECPDPADIREDGRKSSVGKITGRSGSCRPYTRGASRRATRRSLKRADKAKAVASWRLT